MVSIHVQTHVTHMLNWKANKQQINHVKQRTFTIGQHMKRFLIYNHCFKDVFVMDYSG